MIDNFKTLAVAHDGPLLDVQLNSPDTGNALGEPMLDELLTVLGALHDSPEIRVVVLSGAGADFCLGGDRREFAESLAADGSGAALRAMGNKARRVCEALAATSAVTIARLHGGVIGAGIALAVFCDLRAGAHTCRFRLPELALGMPPAWGGVLPRLLNEAGAARIRELILTGESFDAAKAVELSLLHQAVPEGELDEAIARWTRPLVRRSPAALRTAKVMMNAYAGAGRLADATLFDAEMLTSVLAAAGSQRSG
ncbi:methylglutaconyl-CoA hydratase [Streptomyces sp. 2224.1]|uniref:enoyl-CoA hydratase/isomerase family protein n=1 Tax=unclassified Streptomyces TaxID=2593676 RepID=UPI0008919267|nr:MULTISPECIES: enoyl-CoA hydratase/isomerase family protein [unclassified Streptomyces]PBC86669.1 methylglutaconyl-CoA hydratase [Streptomyces sp. 2321.6]SDQ76345.1 methylglutaconyl-CoA hydratase [Streptomyces sp. KS_16]SED52131.1 methylglutaconyl-CoA hydratase [Streptomyces sp. 2112.3]SED85329.1 methylglutaconyl-CoA hydratase [Streptomyces sp. 2224.1]SNC73826.1 methylglutaconyl-CoA hydratase [Streptomyces sp. 2114.4]